MVEFIRGVTKKVKKHVEDMNDCIGKEVVDAVATKKGIVIDRVKNYYDTRVSFIGHEYKPSEITEIKKAGNDVLVCLGEGGKFFVSIDDVEAIGSLVLLKRRVDMPEMTRSTVKNARTFIEKYKSVKNELRKILSSVATTQKGWLNRIMGE